jgi:hypothetical protein
MSKVEIIKGGRRALVHPALADVLVARGGYQRADIASSPVQAVMRAEHAELDSAGEPWSPELHTADKGKTLAGTWRKKRKGGSQA